MDGLQVSLEHDQRSFFVYSLFHIHPILGIILIQIQIRFFWLYFHFVTFLPPPWADSAWAANSSSKRSSKLPRASGDGILFHLTSGTPSWKKMSQLEKIFKAKKAFPRLRKVWWIQQIHLWWNNGAAAKKQKRTQQ